MTGTSRFATSATSTSGGPDTAAGCFLWQAVQSKSPVRAAAPIPFRRPPTTYFAPGARQTACEIFNSLVKFGWIIDSRSQLDFVVDVSVKAGVAAALWSSSDWVNKTAWSHGSW